MNRKWYGVLLIVCVSVLLTACAGESTRAEVPKNMADTANSTRPIIIPPATPTTEPPALERPEVTATPKPEKEPEATATPKPTKKPEPTVTPKPTKKPETTATPVPTKEPTPTVTDIPDQTPETVPGISDVTIYQGETVEAQNAQKGDVIVFGAYEQDGIVENGAERIAWQVVEKTDSRLLLLSVYVLDAKAFHDEAVEVSWKDSSIKEWLQSDFYEAAFLPEEREMLAVSSAGPVFLLSVEEVQRYFSVEKSEQNLQELSDDRLAAEATEYAKSQDVWAMDDNACWWLRSAGEFPGTVVEITEDGSIYRLGTEVDFVYNGVRPAIWLELN